MMNTQENLLHKEATLSGEEVASTFKYCELGHNLFRLWYIARQELCEMFGEDLVDENSDTVRLAFLTAWNGV